MKSLWLAITTHPLDNYSVNSNDIVAAVPESGYGIPSSPLAVVAQHALELKFSQVL